MADASAPPPPERFDEVVDVWNPGGDPAVLRRAAQGWRDMAARLRSLAQDLGAEVDALAPAWEGPASRAFAGHWDTLRSATVEGADRFDEVAAKLDEIADQIEETNQQVHDLYLAIGATIAVGAVLSVVTLGFGTAGAAAAAAAQASRAAAIVARLGSFLTLSVRTMSGFRAALAAFGRRWLLAAGANTLATGVQKAIFNPNHNPLDNWKVSDLTKVVVSSTAGAGLTGAVARSANLGPLATAHPISTAFGTGFAANGGASVVNDVWVDGRPLSPTVLRNAAVNGTAGGMAGAASTGVLGAMRTPNSSPGSLWVPPPRVPARIDVPGLVVVRRPLWVPNGTTAPRLATPAPAPPSPPRLWVPGPATGMRLVPVPPAPPPPPTFLEEALVGVPVEGAVQGQLSAPARPAHIGPRPFPPSPDLWPAAAGM